MSRLKGPTSADSVELPKSKSPSHAIAIGLGLGIVCGILFGEYCQVLDVFGKAYVGLLQMTVLPYLSVSLVAKLGRLDLRQAARLSRIALVILLIMWLIGVLLIVAVAAMLPPTPNSTFYSAPQESAPASQDFLSMLIPANIYHALSSDFVPAVVVFCLFFGVALIPVSGKEPLLDFLDVCSTAISRINLILIRLAPVGLFLLTAAAAGTLRLEELSRLQAYLLILTFASTAASFGILPLLVCGLTNIRYRRFVRATETPVLTAIATGKLFVVLPQVVEECERLLRESEKNDVEVRSGQSTPSVVVPLAYPFPHLGKILSLLFVSFAAWYVGRGLGPAQTAQMAATGVVGSFASPLVNLPFLLDQYQLPQDLMPLFVLPGFITMRLGDMVGVVHLMTLTLIVSYALQGKLRWRWRPMTLSALTLLVGLFVAGAGGRWYLATTTRKSDLPKRLLALKISNPHSQVVVYRARNEVASRSLEGSSTMERIGASRALRVGYRADQMPFCFFNQEGQLVGMDVELLHHLATRLQLPLEFVPWTYETVVQQLDSGEIDVAVGGAIMNPEQLLKTAFTQPYQTVTVSVVVRDHRRHEFRTWDVSGVRLGVDNEAFVVPARQLTEAEIVSVESVQEFFVDEVENLDGIVLSAEAATAWNVVYPDYAVVVPQPVIKRPICMIVRHNDQDWLQFLNSWLDFERIDGSLDRGRRFWIEGEGTKEKPPRWCLLRDVFGWLP